MSTATPHSPDTLSRQSHKKNGRGLADPVFQSQQIFRSIMDAMARPGSLQKMKLDGLEPPSPLTAPLAGVVLTLCDFDTPLWLDATLSKSETVVSYLRFHTGAPIVELPQDAAFALISGKDALIPPGSFNTGTPEYPDRSTTLIIGVENLSNRAGVYLTGPGIKQQQSFGARPLPEFFWPEMISNHAQFPLGVDVIFASQDEIAALPRSTAIRPREE